MMVWVNSPKRRAWARRGCAVAVCFACGGVLGACGDASGIDRAGSIPGDVHDGGGPSADAQPFETDGGGCSVAAQLVDPAECADGTKRYVIDEDGDGFVPTGIIGPTARCTDTPEPGWIAPGDVKGWDCNDRDPSVYRTLYRQQEGDDVPNLPGPERVCVGEEDEPGFEPLPIPCALWSSQNCPSGWFPWGRDADGDGVPRNETDILCLLRGETPGAGWASAYYAVSWEYRDCDDLDPAHSSWGYTDADGDGYSSGQPRCVSPGEAGTVSLGRRGGDDCDDADANVYRIVYADADADGAIGEGRGCAGPDVPPGFTTTVTALDCDDADPASFPDAVEAVFGDGIDQDCDGTDAPPCDSLDLGAAPVAVDPACAGEADLAIHWARGCAEDACDMGTLVLRIANHGGSAFNGEVTVRLTRGGASTDFTPTLTLGPGQVSDLLSYPDQSSGESAVTLVGLTGDCSAANDTAEFVLAGGPCRI